MPISDKQLAQIRRKQQQFLDALIEDSQLWTKELDAAAAVEAGRRIGLEPTLVGEFLIYWVSLGEIEKSYLKLVDQIRTTYPVPGSNEKSIKSLQNQEPHPSKPNASANAFFDLFISHASEDKASVARPLYQALMRRSLSVWFDEAELTLGDSLRRKIDQGLSRCRFGVVILSPSFLDKEWPQRELDGLVARETATGRKAILPIWHNITAEYLLKYSPTLADRLSVTTDKGIDVLVAQIERALTK